MKKLLFISNDLGREDSGGKAVSFRNLELLKKLEEYKIKVISFGEGMSSEFEIIFEVNYSKIELLFKNLFLYAGNLNKKNEKEILRFIFENKYEVVFLDCSLFGRIAKKIKKTNHNIKIITFFHNVEYFYYKERLKLDGVKYFPLVLSSLYNENLSCKYSDKLISLNERDKLILEKNTKGKLI
ncbi:hypothetical protein [Hypnocyclicus thermotrophus]|uniref:hypothetical protein n=1 Tax=Hypnocyclicus thermotrophus TaxID=1627895 RepID=UPI0010647D1D|nr:hypothetical protein [Hypnocyclicus thermotrophus]